MMNVSFTFEGTTHAFVDWTILDQVAVAALITSDDLLAQVLAPPQLQVVDSIGMS